MKKLIVLVCCAALIWSCQHHEKGHSTHEEDGATTHQHDTTNTEVIQLNQGARWLVNAEMKPFVVAGSRLLDDFIAQNGTDYKALAKNLGVENDKLIKSCTMTGKSHDELHKWLHPHLELVKQLAEAKDEAAAHVLVDKLKKSYLLYSEFFE